MAVEQEGDLLIHAQLVQAQRVRITRNAAGLVLVLIGFAVLLYAMTVARLIS